MKKVLLLLLGLLTVLAFLSLMIALLFRGSPIGDKVALVRIEGPIVDSKNPIDEIKEYVKDPSVKAIVLRVDSPGGAVAPSQEIYEEVKKAVEKKKIVVRWGPLRLPAVTISLHPHQGLWQTPAHSPAPSG